MFAVSKMGQTSESGTFSKRHIVYYGICYTFAVVLSSLCKKTSGRILKIKPEAIVPEVKHGPTIRWNDIWLRLWFPYLLFSCFMVHSYKTNGLRRGSIGLLYALFFLFFPSRTEWDRPLSRHACYVGSLSTKQQNGKGKLFRFTKAMKKAITSLTTGLHHRQLWNSLFIIFYLYIS